MRSLTLKVALAEMPGDSTVLAALHSRRQAAGKLTVTFEFVDVLPLSSLPQSSLQSRQRGTLKELGERLRLSSAELNA